MMIIVTRFQQLTITLIVLLAFSNVNADQTTIKHASLGDVVTNDLHAITSGQYKVNGPDPYIIFNAQQQAESVNYLVLDLGTEINNKPLELFFSSENDIFDPHYKLNFIAPSFPAALAIPENTSLTSSTRLRLDIEGCPACTVAVNNVPILGGSSAGAILIEPSSVRNGVDMLDVETKPITTSGWRLNDLSGDFSGFEVSAGDPYIVSPLLDISTRQFAGVYFKLSAPRSGEIWNNYQLFYQTERHGFIIEANSTFRIPDSQTSTIEFMIPLGFLSNELPSDRVLERLRLDLPEVPGHWSVVEARLIHQDSANKFKHLVPPQLSHTKQQRARSLSLMKKSLHNVLADLGFSISYLLLLVFTGFFFLRAYRSAS